MKTNLCPLQSPVSFARGALTPPGFGNRFLGHLLLTFALLTLLGSPAFAVVSLNVSPSVVSNTYGGIITLQLTGVAAGDSVGVQKFLDVNTNGVIDAGDLLWQQFNLTDGQGGQVIDGVTNLNVPGDTDTTAGQITAKLNFQMEFSQTFAGKYLFKVSSPSGHFFPLTNSLLVTNFSYSQKFTGTVLSNGVAVPFASILLFPGSGKSNGGSGSPVASAVASASGVYSLPAPAGTYSLAGFKSGFVANVGAAANVVLENGGTITTNITLIAATQTISGRVEDMNNPNPGLPGLLGAVQTQTGLLGICFTDTNGNFTVGVNPGKWRLSGESADLALHGYVGVQGKTTVDTTTGSVAGVTLAFPKASALFYGKVSDSHGNPLPGVVAIYANDNNDGLYQSDGYADTNGNYVTAVLGGLGAGDPWWVGIDNTASYPDDVFSQPAFDLNGGTNIAVGQAVLANFTAASASNSISGNVKAFGANLAGAGVSASATINGVYYSLNNVDTDVTGNYSLTVGNGVWSVNLSCQGGSDSLDSLLGYGNYQCPENVTVTIANDNATANFSIVAPQTFQISTPSLASGIVGVSYLQSLSASGGQPPYAWQLADGSASLPSGLSLSSGGVISGMPASNQTATFIVEATDANSMTTTKVFSLAVNPVPTLAGSAWSNGQFQMQLSGATNQNYTLQMATSLSSPDWISVFSTNSPAASTFLLVDPNATNQQRYYRVLIGP